MKQLWEESMKPESAKSGFRQCGIFPLDESAIPGYHFDSSELLTQRSNSEQTTTSLATSNPGTAASIPSTSTDTGNQSDILRTPTRSDVRVASPSTADQSSASSDLAESENTDSEDSSVCSTPSIKDFFLQHIHIAGPSNQKRKRPSERVKRMKYGESLTSEECIQRYEEEERLRKEKEKEKEKRKRGKKQRITRKRPTRSETEEMSNSADPEDSDGDFQELEELDPADLSPAHVDGDEVEKCDSCGKIDDGTNSDSFIGCDLCPKWFCISPCSGIQNAFTGDLSTIDFVCEQCQNKM